MACPNVSIIQRFYCIIILNYYEHNSKSLHACHNPVDQHFTGLLRNLCIGCMNQHEFGGSVAWYVRVELPTVTHQELQRPDWAAVCWLERDLEMRIEEL